MGIVSVHLAFEVQERFLIAPRLYRFASHCIAHAVSISAECLGLGA